MNYYCVVCKEPILTAQASESMKFGPILCQKHLEPVKAEVLERRKLDRRKKDYYRTDMEENRLLKERLWELEDRRQA